MESTPTSSWVGDYKHEFESRDRVFKEALELLQPDHKTQVIALFGYSGVGKTTMMRQLKRIVRDRNMFDFIVQIDVGDHPDMFSIQQCVADCIGLSLTNTTINTRAECLGTGFEEISRGKKSVLIILDDVWQPLALKDIGFNSLPNGYKLLLTSRDQGVCIEIAFIMKSASTLLYVHVLKSLEAHNLFWELIGVTEEYDPELYRVGCEIVNQCMGLPLAITIMAKAVKSRDKPLWIDALDYLKCHDEMVAGVLKLSYKHLEEEERKMFILCGLFSESAYISIEDLAKYAWGLKLFNGIVTVKDARDRTKECVHKLMNASLLHDVDEPGCIKFHHNLIREFLVSLIFKHGISLMINPSGIK